MVKNNPVTKYKSGEWEKSFADDISLVFDKNVKIISGNIAEISPTV
jgi:hypothetical protein